MKARWILLVFLTGCTFAQTPPAGEVSGHILNSRDKEPLELVQIQLLDTAFEAETDSDGMFRITSVPAGHYELQAGAVGYYQSRQTFDLAAGEVKKIEISLTSSTTKRVETIEVTAGAFEDPSQPVSAAAFTLEGPERQNLASVLSDDPIRAAQSMPGVTSNNDFDSQFSLRGASFDRIGLFLDGILLHSPFHAIDSQTGDGSLTIFNGDMTGEMTLYEGAWPTLFGDRTAGVLSVSTRDGNRSGLHGRVSASASNASVMAEGPFGTHKKGSWMLAFRKSYLQYLLSTIDSGTSNVPLAFAFTDGEAHLNYDLTSNHTVSLTYIDGGSGVDRTQYQKDLGVNAVMNSGFRFSFVNLGSQYTLGKHAILTNHLAWTRERGDVENRDFAPLSHQAYGEWTWRGDATINWAKSTDNDATLSLGALYRRASEQGLATQYLYVPLQTPSIDTFRGTGTQAGGYAQQAFGFDKNRAHLTLGLRQDAHSDSAVQVTSPYGSVSFMPAKKTRLQFDWGQYAQFAELSQFYSIFARTHLLPQRATHYEASIEHQVDDRTRLRLEFYDRQDRDLLARPLLDPRVVVTGGIFPGVLDAPLSNEQRGYSRGFQVFLQRRSANGFTGWVSYAYGKNEIHDGVLNIEYPSDYDQRHTFNAYVSRRLRPTINMSLKVTYGTGMPLPGFYKLGSTSNTYFLSANRNGLRAPAYQRTDLRLNKAWIHRRTTTTLYAEAINITNHHNRDFDSPGPYDTAGHVYPNFFSMFPILPSAGISFEY